MVDKYFQGIPNRVILFLLCLIVTNQMLYKYHFH